MNVSTLVFEEPRRNRHLVVHLARDISHRKKSEELLAKMLAISKEVVAVADHNTRVAPVSPLAEQEQRILRLFAKAKNSSEIARDLGITLPTLRNHLHSINEKLRTHNRLEAVMHAMQRGLIWTPSLPPCEHNGCSWACDKRIIVILPQKPESIEKEANR